MSSQTREKSQASFRQTLGSFEAFVVSLSIIAPTLAMSFNVTLAVKAAGRAAPLSFVIGGAIMALVGLSFVAFSRRIVSAGSAYSYVDAVFGRRWAFLAGWGLAFSYFAFLASATGLVGGFLASALGHAGLKIPGLWLLIALAGAWFVIALGGREIKLATLFMSVVEAIAIAAIVGLAAVILVRVPLSAAPFQPDPGRGVTGVGYGIVFAVLSFAGFEGAASVAEETRDPHRAIPIAIIGSAVVATCLYTLVVYAQVLGYGTTQAQALASAQAPLDTLSTRFISPAYGTFLDVAAGISALAGAVASAAATARLLFVLGRDGFLPQLAAIDPVHGAPKRAAWLAGGINIVLLLAWGSWAGAQDYSGALATIGTLALIPIYMAVGLAQMVDARRRGSRRWAAIGLLGALLLCWPLFNSLYPVPDWPASLWPFLVAAWMLCGFALSLRRRSPSPDQESRS